MILLMQIILVVVFSVSFALAVYALRSRPALGAVTFFILMLEVLVWASGSFAETTNLSIEQRIFWLKVGFTGLALVPATGSYLNFQFARVFKLATPAAMGLLHVEPIFAILLAWTNDFHHMYWSSFRIIQGPILETIQFNPGNLYWIHFVFSVIVVSLSCGFLIREALKSSQLLRKQLFVLLLGTLFPFVSRLIYVSVLNERGWVDPSPFFLVLTSGFYFWGLFKYKMLDIVPVAYDAIIEGMSDGLIITDISGRIVEINVSAVRLLGLRSTSAVGIQATEILGQFQELIPHINSNDYYQKELSLTHKDEIIICQFQFSPILNKARKISGRLLLIRNITEERKRENTQRRRTEELEALHNILLDITASRDPKELMQTIVERAVKLLNGVGGSLYLCDQRKQELRCVATINNPFEPGNSIYNFGKGPGQIALTGKTIITNRKMKMGDETGPTSLIGVPLLWQGSVNGVILIMDDRVGDGFSGEDQLLLEMLARQVTIVVENARLLQEERQQREQAETLREVTASLNSSLDLDRVLDLILEQLARVVPYDSTSLMLIQDDQVRIVAQRGFRASQDEFPNLQIDKLLHARQVIEQQSPMIIPDTSKEPSWIKWMEAEYIHCWMGVPLVYQGKSIGLLNLDKEQPNYYTEADGHLAAAFANQAVIAIENARLFENAARRAQEAETIRKATSAVAATLKQEEAIELILDQLAWVVPYASASIQLLEDNDLVIVGGRGWKNGEKVVGFRFPIPGDNPNTVVIQNRQPLILEDAPKTFPTFRTSIHSHIKSWLGVPLIVHDRVIGMLTLDGSKEYSFSQEHVNLVTAFADQVAIAIENSRLYAESEQRASNLSRLYSAAQDLMESLEPDVILQKLIRNINQALSVTSTYILQVNQEIGTLEVLAEYFSEEACPEERVSDLHRIYHLEDYPVVMEAYRSGAPINYSSDSPTRTTAEKAELTRYGVQSALMVPLTLRGKLIGEVEIWESRYPRRFSEAEKQLAIALSQHATAVLENARLYEQEKMRVAELDALRATMADISSELELPKLLRAILQRAVEFLKADGGELGLFNEQKCLVEIAASHNMDDDTTGTSVQLGEGVMGKVAQNRESIFVPSYRTWDGKMERYNDISWSTVVAVPMMFRNRLMGVLGIVDKDPDRQFGEQDTKLLNMFAQQAVIAVENATLYQEQRTAAEKRAILHHVSQEVVATSLDPEGIYTALHNAASQLMPSEAFAITIVDDTRNMIDAVYLFDHKGRSKPISFPKGRGLSGHVIESGEAVYIPDLLDTGGSTVESIRVGDKEDVRSIIAVPMKLGDKITGTLSAQSYQGQAYTPEDIRLLEMLASYAAIALENARLFQEVQKLAITDPLLGIFNRRELFALGQREFNRSLRFGRPLAIILYDIDDFKNINDSYGHAIGDAVLIQLSERVQEMIREIDTLGRFGGDEFVIVLPETTRTAAEWVAERIRKKVAETPFYTDVDVISITISVGVTELTPDISDFEELVARADAAQYDAKLTGKNSVGSR